MIKKCVFICTILCFSISYIHSDSYGPNGDCVYGTYKDGDVCRDCPAGYFGNNCTDKCIHPTFGILCSEICDCSDCHHIIGCISNAVNTEKPNKDCLYNSYKDGDVCKDCPAGYFGYNCTDKCKHPTFGFLCLQSCHCPVCHHVVGCVSTTVKIDEFGEDCFSSNGGLKEDAKIIVRYEGKTVSICNYFSFEPASSTETGISHKLCVRPLNFTDPDCSVQLEMKSSYLGSRLHTITCYTGTTANFCGDEDNDLYIFFKERGYTSTNNARFMLQVYAQRVDNSAIVLGVIGGVLAAIVLFSAGAGLVFWCVCKRKPAQGRVINHGQPNAGTAVNQPAYPYASYSTQAGNPVTNLYPVGNYPTQYSSGTTPHPQYQYQPQPQTAFYQEPEKVPSAPPPSYDEAHQ